MSAELLSEVMGLRRLLAEVYTAMLAAGWPEDDLPARVKAASVGATVAVIEPTAAQKQIAELEAALRNFMAVPEVKKAAVNWATDELLAAHKALDAQHSAPNPAEAGTDGTNGTDAGGGK